MLCGLLGGNGGGELSQDSETTSGSDFTFDVILVAICFDASL